MISFIITTSRMSARFFNRSISKSVLFFFSLFLSIGCNYGQTVEPSMIKSYLANIADTMWDIVKNYGISNLPVPDYKLPYNVTDYYGYALVGHLYLEEGFVFDASKFLYDTKYLSMIPNSQNFLVKGKINIQPMAIFQDFRFEFNNLSNYQEKANGSVITELKLFSFNFQINKTYLIDEIESFVQDFSYTNTKPFLTFYPENALTQRIRKNYINEAGKQVNYVLDGLKEKWKPAFNKFFKAAVTKVKFPYIEF